MKRLDQEFEALAKSDQRARLLRSLAGIGALNATALAAAVGDVSAFAKGRDLAAWLGLVPRQITTGGKPRLTGISKRGSTYMRVLLIHGARAALPDLARMDTPLGAWLRALLPRAKRNEVVVALANKLARIARAVMSNQCPYEAVTASKGQRVWLSGGVPATAWLHGLCGRMYTEMAQRLIGVRQTCRQAAALSRSSILLGAGRANLHLGTTPKAPRPDTLVQPGCASQNTLLAERAGHTLPAAAPIVRQPDRAGLPVTMLRHSDGKVRHDGSRAANKQRCYPVAERGRLHSASKLDARVRDLSVEHRIVYYRRLEEERRWKESLETYDRLGRQDKRAHIVRRSVGCFCWNFRHF
ncbi:transposase [Mesorhizobium sp.]|uniref:transposase n=1 Tax=Mesorhizobium sp. TaxID=1871066 RepID=UPI002580B4A6|nr:transposase [Mesorhizobium sp.]